MPITITSTVAPSTQLCFTLDMSSMERSSRMSRASEISEIFQSKIQLGLENQNKDLNSL